MNFSPKFVLIYSDRMVFLFSGRPAGNAPLHLTVTTAHQSQKNIIMHVNGTPYRCIWPDADGRSVGIIDQTKLPHYFATVTLRTLDDAVLAISDMLVRGAPPPPP
ncbi:MAG: hypothetical protein D3914_16595, partial [Candidatus Electrothrix sp. LOE2]|nr:hypothetical protein [Candidatus Electrothrix sp. LOE2]